MDGKDKNIPKPHGANEPTAFYGKTSSSKKITISTLKDQEEEMYLFWIKLTPVERLKHVYNMHKNIYGEEVATSDINITHRIHFDHL
jgi:hypothetical protein